MIKSEGCPLWIPPRLVNTITCLSSSNPTDPVSVYLKVSPARAIKSI